MEYTTVTVDLVTNEVIEREMTAEEIADLEQIVITEQAKQTELIAKAAARQSALAKLADLGLTAEEIAAL